MSLNVNYTALYQNGIDRSMLKEVSKEILNRAAQKNSQYSNAAFTPSSVNSIAQPVELGADLYNGKLDIRMQKQIAMNNSFQFQLNTETLNSIKFLNSQAAISSKIDGKYIPNVTTNEVAPEAQKVAETNKSQFMSITTSQIAKDKNGSNPFYGGELLMNNNSSHKEETKK